VPDYILNFEIWKGLWPIPVAALIIAGLLTLCSGIKRTRRTLFSALCGFAVLGLVVGVMAGQSREPVIGAVLPAILSFLGGAAAFMMTKGPTMRMTVGLTVVAFSLSILIGANWGADTRTRFELLSSSIDRQKQLVADKLELELFESEARSWYQSGEALSAQTDNPAAQPNSQN